MKIDVDVARALLVDDAEHTSERPLEMRAHRFDEDAITRGGRLFPLGEVAVLNRHALRIVCQGAIITRTSLSRGAHEGDRTLLTRSTIEPFHQIRTRASISRGSREDSRQRRKALPLLTDIGAKPAEVWLSTRREGMNRYEPGAPGVVVYRAVPIQDVHGQTAFAYLTIVGVPRSQPSHMIRVFFDDPHVDARTKITHASFAASAFTYNSPAGHGAKGPLSPGVAPPTPGPYDLQIDVSDAVQRLGARSEVDVSFVLVDPSGAPLHASDFHYDDVSITRRA